MLHFIRKISRFNLWIRKSILLVSKLLVWFSIKWRVAGVVAVKMNHVSARFYSQCDDPIVDALVYGRKYVEYSDLILFLTLAKQSKYIFDIGAFTGLYSIFSAKSNQTANVYAFEPNPVNFARLQFNRDINALTNLQCYAVAVGSAKSNVNIHGLESEEISDTSSVHRDFSQSTYSGVLRLKTIPVQQISIDEFVTSQQIARVDLIKIDVENYEIEVFEGLSKTIQNYRPIVLCEIFLDDWRIRYFNAFVKENKYCLYQVIDEGIIRLDSGILPNHDGLNYLFAPGATHNVFTSFKEIGKMIIELMR